MLTFLNTSLSICKICRSLRTRVFWDSDTFARTLFESFSFFSLSIEQNIFLVLWLNSCFLFFYLLFLGSYWWRQLNCTKYGCIRQLWMVHNHCIFTQLNFPFTWYMSMFDIDLMATLFESCVLSLKIALHIMRNKLCLQLLSAVVFIHGNFLWK